MQTWHIKTLLTQAASFAKPFMVFEWNILKLVWSKIFMFLNAGHSDND